MRQVWVDAGSDPDYVKLDANGITDPFFDGRWLAAKNTAVNPKVSLAYLQYVRTKLPNPGIYLADPVQWPGIAPADPEGWADWAYDLVQRKIAPGTGGSFPLVDLNYEQDDPQWLLAMLKRWRLHSPKRVTGWNVQANKAGLYTGIVSDLVSMNILVKPECYLGQMDRVESAYELDAWIAAGMPREMIVPMLDGKALGQYWQGSVFTMGRIPA